MSAPVAWQEKRRDQIPSRPPTRSSPIPPSALPPGPMTGPCPLSSTLSTSGTPSTGQVMMTWLWHRRRYQRQRLCHGNSERPGDRPSTPTAAAIHRGPETRQRGAYQWHTFYGSSDATTMVTASLSIPAAMSMSRDTAMRPGDRPSMPTAATDDIFVLKLNSQGAYQWHTFYGSDSYDCGLRHRRRYQRQCLCHGIQYATWGSPLNAHSGEL